MKRLIIVILLLVCFATQIFAGGLGDFLALTDSVVNLVNSGVGNSKDAKATGNDSLSGVIQNQDPRILVKEKAERLSLNLDEVGRQKLYEEYKVNLFGPLCLSLFLGCGSGQRAMGDYKGSAWITPIETIGLSSIAVGGLFYCFGWVFRAFWDKIAKKEVKFSEYGNYPVGKLCVGVMLIGGGLAVIDRLIAMVRVLTWGTSYNKSLRLGLGLNKNLKMIVAAEPYISEDLKVGVRMAASIAF